MDLSIKEDRAAHPGGHGDHHSPFNGHTNSQPPDRSSVPRSAEPHPVEQTFRDPTFEPIKAGNGPPLASPNGVRRSPRKKSQKLCVRDLSPTEMADAEVARVRKAEQVAEIGRYKNSAVVLVCVAQDDPRPLLPTCDSYDSAHGKKDGSGGLNDYLVPNARRPVDAPSAR